MLFLSEIISNILFLSSIKLKTWQEIWGQEQEKEAILSCSFANSLCKIRRQCISTSLSTDYPDNCDYTELLVEDIDSKEFLHPCQRKTKIKETLWSKNSDTCFCTGRQDHMQSMFFLWWSGEAEIVFQRQYQINYINRNELIKLYCLNFVHSVIVYFLKTEYIFRSNLVKIIAK